MSYFFNRVESTGSPINTTFDPVTSENMKLKAITIKVDVAPTTAENFVLTLISGQAGTNFNVVLYSIDLSAASTTDVLNADINLPLANGDALRATYTNTDQRTMGVQVIMTNRGE
jgi:hypothetical protein